MQGLREDWERDGFAVIRGAIPAAEVVAMAEGFTRLLAMARRLGATADLQGSRFVLDAEPFRLHRVVWCGGAEPALAPWGADPRFVEPARAVLGTDRLVQLIQQAHFKMPGDEVGFSWHQDASNRRYGTDLWTDVNGEGSFVQMALAVDPMRSDNGPLRVLPGSHRLGFIADPETGALPPDLPYDDAIDLRLEPGDIALFGPFLVHGSPPNRSAGPRRLFLQGYAVQGANRRVYPGCGIGVTRG